MRLDELMNTIVRSDPSDWNHIACWGAGSSPSYRDKFSFYEIYGGTKNVLHHEAHSSVAVYRPNVSITIAFGLRINDDFKEKWANEFPDPPGQQFLC